MIMFHGGEIFALSERTLADPGVLAPELQELR
jgi:hypothetical protein